ncbi:MAG: hypothetical protein EXR71_17290 [Myxococcales bacterium]|nr:hypothetical protein [Myxococcales bacterium]
MALLCEVCATPGTLADNFLVRTAFGVVSIGGTALLDRLRSGQLSGQDWLVADDREPLMIAAHPVFASLYLRGEIPPPQAVVVHAPSKSAPRVRFGRVRPALPWGRMFRTVITLGALGGGAYFAFTHQRELREVALDLSELVAPANETEAAANLSLREPAPDTSRPQLDPLGSLPDQEGHVEEPLALLEARAVEAWSRGGPDDLREGLAHARRAVARATKDADAVALLAILAALSGDQPGLTQLAAQQAIALGQGNGATELGRAALAIANGAPADAVAAVAACAKSGDRVCRYVAASQNPDRAAAVAGLDQLAADWPSHRGVPRAAALLSAAADAPDAGPRLDALHRKDALSIAVRAQLHVQDGEGAQALAVAQALGAEAPDGLRVAVARVSLATGDVVGVIDLIRPVVDAGGKSGAYADALLLLAQARWLQARDVPANQGAASEAVGRLVTAGRTDPAVAQVRALVAHGTGDKAEQSRAWLSMDPALRSGPELARVLRTQVALMESANIGGSEVLPVAEAARVADRSDPFVHVWLVHLHLGGHSPARAIDALRTAIREVDGQSGRRRTDLATLETGSPARMLVDEVDAALGNNATFATSLPMARAAAAWLGGDLDLARRTLSRHPALETDPDAMALRARLRLAAGDTAGAVSDWDKVVAQRPKQAEYLLGSLHARVTAGQAMSAVGVADLVASSRITSPQSYALLAEVQAAVGDRSGAIRLLETCISKDAFDIAARRRLRALRTAD